MTDLFLSFHFAAYSLPDLGFSLTDFFAFVGEIFFEILWDVIKFGFLGFIVALMLMIVCARYKLFKRRWLALKALTFLYWLYVPIVVGFFSGAMGAIHGAQEFVGEEVHAMIQPLSEKSFVGFQGYVDENSEKIIEIEDDLSGALDGYMDYEAVQSTQVGDGESVAEPEGKDRFSDQIVRWGITMLLEKGKEKALEKSADMAGIDEGSLEHALIAAEHLDVEELNTKVWTSIQSTIVGKINGMFTGFYIQILIMMFMFLAIPILETVISSLVRRRQAGKVDEKAVEQTTHHPAKNHHP
jgi:hypothetical protein